MREHIKDYICDQAEMLANNNSKTTNCPFCHAYEKFSVTKRDRAILYHCYRSSCGKSGVIHLHSGLSKEDIAFKLNRRPVQQQKEFRLPDYLNLGIGSPKVAGTLVRYNLLEIYKKGLFTTAYDPKEDRIVFLIKDEKGNPIAAIGKTFNRKIMPKVKNYPGSAILPYIVGQGNTAILVEDCISACCVATQPGYVGIAILGTNLKPEYIKSIIQYNKIIVALDRDATHKAIEIKRMLTFYHHNVGIWILDEDIKDMEPHALQEFISQRETGNSV